jgi:uncharacterized protein YcfJ
MKTTITVLAALFGAAALPPAQANEFEDFGRVVRVEPRVEQVRQPRQECRTEYVQVPVQQSAPQRSAGGGIVGGIAGALLGNQVGGGSGRVAATAAGAIAGAMIGDRMENGSQVAQAQAPAVQEQAVRQCRVVDAYESRTVGYDVTYEFRGRTYTSLMARDPGPRIRLRVSVEPDHNY